ncbi:MAG: hypothetical protein QXE79_08045 [Candidatus Bathyarchaeia archaeon]
MIVRGGWLKALRISILVVLAASVAAIVFAESRLAHRLIDRLGYPALCQDLFSEVESNYIRVRELSPPQTVKLNVVNLKWIEENWVMRSGGYDAQLEVDEAIYKALMFMPDEASMAAIHRRRTLSIMAAASAGEVYVVEEYFNPLDRVAASKTIAHELTHIVQGYYFPDHTSSTYDEAQAWNALIEGDASYTADRYAEYTKASRGYSASGGGGDIPSPMMELWLFPYRYGVGFISQLYDAGGWSLVNRAYYKPPNTTEQVLHPEKYLAGEAFQEVASPKPEGGYKVIRTDRFGEHFIRVFLSSHIDIEESVKASNGWNGDNFTYYKVDGKDLFTWSIAWDTREDQVEFHESIEALMEAVEAIPSGNGTWRISWRQLKIMETPMEEGYITYLEITTSHTSHHTWERHPPTGYGIPVISIKPPKDYRPFPIVERYVRAESPRTLQGSLISGS